MSTTPAPPPEVAGCVIRPPSDAEWPACRMLLPHAFRAGTAPEGLLAFVGGGAIGGAAAFRISEGLLHDLAIRVPRPCRRRGIGSRLLERVCELAAARGLSAIHAVVDATAEPGAALFLEARGFVCEHRFRLVEGDVHRLRDRIIPLRDRLRACGRIPPGARIAGPGEVPAEEVARLYAGHILTVRRFHPGYVLPMVSGPRIAHSAVLVVEGRVEGMVLWEVDAGTGAATVYGRVVSEAYRGGWANALLVAAAVETAAALGVKRCRFEVPEGNRDTEKLMLRAGAALVSETAIFVRLVSGADRPMRQS